MGLEPKASNCCAIRIRIAGPSSTPRCVSTRARSEVWTLWTSVVITANTIANPPTATCARRADWGCDGNGTISPHLDLLVWMEQTRHSPCSVSVTKSVVRWSAQTSGTSSSGTTSASGQCPEDRSARIARGRMAAPPPNTIMSRQTSPPAARAAATSAVRRNARPLNHRPTSAVRSDAVGVGRSSGTLARARRSRSLASSWSLFQRTEASTPAA
jgi:hypothetical protein